MSTPELKHKFDGFEPEVSDSEIQQRWEKLKPLLPKPRRHRRFWFFLFPAPLMLGLYMLWPVNDVRAGIKALTVETVAMGRASAHREFFTLALSQHGFTHDKGENKPQSGQVDQQESLIDAKHSVTQRTKTTPSSETNPIEGAALPGINQKHLSGLSERQAHEASGIHLAETPGAELKKHSGSYGTQHGKSEATKKSRTNNVFQTSGGVYTQAKLPGKDNTLQAPVPAQENPFFLPPLTIHTLHTKPGEPLESSMKLLYKENKLKLIEYKSAGSKEIEIFAGVNIFSTDTGRTKFLRPGRPLTMRFSAGVAYHYVTPKRVIWSTQLIYLRNALYQQAQSQQYIPVFDSSLIFISYNQNGYLRSRHSLMPGAGIGYRLINKSKLNLDASLMVNARISLYRYDYSSFFGNTKNGGPTYLDSVHHWPLKASVNTSDFSKVQYRVGINLNINPMLTLTYKITPSLAFLLKAGYAVDLMDQRLHFKNRDEINDDDRFRERQNNLLLYVGLRYYLNPQKD